MMMLRIRSAVNRWLIDELFPPVDWDERSRIRHQLQGIGCLFLLTLPITILVNLVLTHIR